MIENCLSKVLSTRIVVPAKTVLLEAGAVSIHMYLIRSGCARLWYNNNGEDITLQFFMPGQVVASFDSILHNIPSEFTLETILPTEVDVFEKRDIEAAFKQNAESSMQLAMQAFELASKYKNLFLSRIKDTPQQRYESLLREHPDIVAQIPQHYIATYLGVTPVSLSRIRARIGKS
ncbi:MAG: Crp/Fnr family transcriptional regulator [Alistipes sp.]|nr:Crp/Fnr family transcriptional regulator [Alistipes sp.]